MKKLYIIRHAKSSWDNLLIKDFDRPLNERGEKDAPRMAKRLKERSVFPDIILSSPANRALTTCKAFCRVLQLQEKQIQTDHKLYHASEDDILEVVRGIKDRKNDKEEIVFLFGHNPGLTEFVNSLLNEEIDNIPTCGIVVCSLSVKTWKEVSRGSGELEFFDYPKKKD